MLKQLSYHQGFLTPISECKWPTYACAVSTVDFTFIYFSIWFPCLVLWWLNFCALWKFMNTDTRFINLHQSPVMSLVLVWGCRYTTICWQQYGSVTPWKDKWQSTGSSDTGLQCTVILLQILFRFLVLIDADSFTLKCKEQNVTVDNRYGTLLSVWKQSM